MLAELHSSSQNRDSQPAMASAHLLPSLVEAKFKFGEREVLIVFSTSTGYFL